MLNKMSIFFFLIDNLLLLLLLQAVLWKYYRVKKNLLIQEICIRRNLRAASGFLLYLNRLNYRDTKRKIIFKLYVIAHYFFMYSHTIFMYSHTIFIYLLHSILCTYHTLFSFLFLIQCYIIKGLTKTYKTLGDNLYTFTISLRLVYFFSFFLTVESVLFY